MTWRASPGRRGNVRSPVTPRISARANWSRFWSQPMWGIIPAAGKGSRIQPLAFSKELLPVGGQNENGIERPRAVSDYLVERLVIGGATRLCFVIGPGKSDIVEYYGAAARSTPIFYVVQSQP